MTLKCCALLQLFIFPWKIYTPDSIDNFLYHYCPIDGYYSIIHDITIFNVVSVHHILGEKVLLYNHTKLCNNFSYLKIIWGIMAKKLVVWWNSFSVLYCQLHFSPFLHHTLLPDRDPAVRVYSMC